MKRRADGMLFVLLLGMLWIGLSLALSLSQIETALVAAAFLLIASLIQLFSRDTEEEEGAIQRRWRATSYRTKVDVLAGIVAIAAGVGTGLLLLPESNPESIECAPGATASKCSVPVETTTKTTETTESGTGADGKTGKDGKTTVVEEKSSAPEANSSLVGRAVDNPAGVIVVRIGLALLAAFIAGLVTQRICLGKYGVKLPFGLGEFPEVTDAKAAAVTEQAKRDRQLGAALERSKSSGAQLDPTSPGDTRIKLIAMRDDVEESLRTKAKGVDGVDPLAPIGQVIDGLGDREVIGSSGRSALRDMIELGDRAAKGAEIEPGVRSWLVSDGQYLPEAINYL